jgi:hypothetical protein
LKVRQRILVEVLTQVYKRLFPVILIALAFALANFAFAQSPVKLDPYTTPDKSATAGVPSGWTVIKGADTAIVMTGPKGETVFLGDTIVAHNSAFALGEAVQNGIDISMPYSSPLQQKLIMIVEQGVALGHGMPPQLSITSATSVASSPTLGQCGRYVANGVSIAGPIKLMAVICSLPLDSGGTYKNILLLAQAPAVIADSEVPLVHAVFTSYQVPPAMLQRKLAPFTAPPVATPSAGMRMPQAVVAAPAGDVSQCFDLVVIRQLPKNQLPISCGGTSPN